VFESDGISTQDMMESRNILQYISEQYMAFSKWEDKFFDEKMNPDGRPVINDKAILNDEQQKIAQELQELDDCFISSVGRA